MISNEYDYIDKIISTGNIQTIVEERDKYVIGSAVWSIFDTAKTDILSKTKPSTNEIILYFNENEIIESDSIFIPSTEEIFASNLKKELWQKFARRCELEYAAGQYRHPIPYVILKHKNEYFFILREKGSGELRLIGKKGLVGGHIGVEDCNLEIEETISNGMHRELLEEVGVTKDMIDSIDYLGAIKSNIGVDKDHLGLVHLIELNTKDIKAEEDGVLSGIWVKEEDIKNHVDSFENWLKIIYDNGLLGRCSNES